MSDYLHGAYGQQEESGLSVPASSGTLPVYFGAAPTHLLSDFSGKAGVPIVLRSAAQARAAIGYSGDWALFPLCEAIFLHFMSGEPIGPIVAVNTLEPETMRKETKTTAALTFVGGRAVLSDPLAIANTVMATGANAGTALTAVYDDQGGGLSLRDPAGMLSGNVTVEYFALEPARFPTASALCTAIAAATPMVYEAAGLPPSILCAPGADDEAGAVTALVRAAKGINGHWNAFVYSDLPTDGVKTVDGAMAKKAASPSYGGETICPCWPLETDGLHTFHLSVLSVHRAMLTDRENGDTPFETASNKLLPITGLLTRGESGTEPLRFDKLEANRLNAKGIRTAIFWGGRWRLWGSHTGAYDYNAANLPEEIFEPSVRMLQWLGNQFALSCGEAVDRPMHRSRIDSILDMEQEKLDALVNRGALLYGSVSFEAAPNPKTDLMAGQFLFDTGLTTTPPARAMINRYRYTARGLATLTGGGKDE